MCPARGSTRRGWRSDWARLHSLRGSALSSRPGRLDLSGPQGLALLAHELTHLGQPLAFKHLQGPLAQPAEGEEQAAEQQEAIVERIAQQGWPDAQHPALLGRANGPPALRQGAGDGSGGEPERRPHELYTALGGRASGPRIGRTAPSAATSMTLRRTPAAIPKVAFATAIDAGAFIPPGLGMKRGALDNDAGQGAALGFHEDGSASGATGRVREITPPATVVSAEEAGSPDLDALARQIYIMLRARLRAERERCLINQR